MQISDVGKLGKYGILGVMLGLIGLATFLVLTLQKVVTNEMEHSQAAIERNTEALGGIKGAMEGNTEVIRSIQQILLIKGR